jgi:alkylation response protein AidB-like acyl-CoA dehydrogenase
MSLLLDEEQQMLAYSARDLLATKAPVSQIRELREAGLGYDPKVWQEMVDMGWPAIHIPEAYGGLGYGYRGLGILLEQSGRTLSSSPLISSVLAASTLLMQAANEQQKQQYLPGLAAGSLRMTVAMDETPHHNPNTVRMQAVKKGDGYILYGLKTTVMDADTSNSMIVVTRDDDGQWLLLLVDANTAGLRLEPMRLTDERSYSRVYFDDVQVPASARLDGSDEIDAALQQSLDVINIGLATEMYGMARACFEQTVEYLKERKQFGVFIGSFQALQHRAAHMLTELELAESLVRAALLALEEETDAAKLSEIACAAKVKLSRVTHQVVTEAVQMHGGMGMTDELNIGFYMKRSRVAQQLFGDRQFHVDRFATLRGY